MPINIEFQPASEVGRSKVEAISWLIRNARQLYFAREVYQLLLIPISPAADCNNGHWNGRVDELFDLLPAAYQAIQTNDGLIIPRNGDYDPQKESSVVSTNELRQWSLTVHQSYQQCIHALLPFLPKHVGPNNRE